MAMNPIENRNTNISSFDKNKWLKIIEKGMGLVAYRWPRCSVWRHRGHGMHVHGPNSTVVGMMMRVDRKFIKTYFDTCKYECGMYRGIGFEKRNKQRAAMGSNGDAGEGHGEYRRDAMEPEERNRQSKRMIHSSTSSSTPSAVPLGDRNGSLYEEPTFSPRRMIALMRSLLGFALPTLLVPLADPIMSLIDTIALGQWSSSLSLASLGPCSLIFNFCFYSFMALSIATVSVTAERIGKGSFVQAGDAIGAALFLSIVGGTVVSLILLGFGPSLLRLTRCDPILLPLANEYLMIRSLAAPAAVYTSVAQSALLGQRDSKTPFKIVLISIVASFLGDVILIGGLKMGVRGAAWTTVIAQIGSALLLSLSLKSSKAAPTRKLPNWQEMINLWQVAKHLGVFYVAKTTSYLILQANATQLPAAMLAAHQPMWQLWGLCSFANTPLEQAALAFIPSSNSNSERQELIVAIVCSGLVLSTCLIIVAQGIPAFFPGILVSDKALWPLMQSIWIPGSLALLACGLDVSSTGVLLANKDSAYVARSMLVSLSALAIFIYLSRDYLNGLQGVWWSLFAFFVMRMLQSFPRAIFHHFAHLRTENDTYIESEVLKDMNIRAT